MAKSVRHHLPSSTDVGSSSEPKRLTKQEFGRRLASLIAERGWNQSDLARRAGIGRDAVSTYIRGRSYPEPKNLTKLAKALDMSPAALLPNVVASAIEADDSPFELREASGHPGHAWLKVNRLVTMAQAMRVMQVLNEGPDADQPGKHD